MTPTEYLALKVYEGANRIVADLDVLSQFGKASLFITGIRVGIALCFHKPDVAVTILQVLRLRTGSITESYTNDQEVLLISMLLGAEIWKNNPIEPTVN
jgi:hypothetical protein